MISLDTGLWQRGPSSSFSPLSLSPALWLDASDASTLFQSNGGAAAAADGDPVGYWLDKSGNGKHVSQTSGTNKPLLKTGANGKNGRNVLLFNSVNNYMTCIAASNISQPFTFFAVGRTTNVSSGGKQFFDCAVGGGARSFFGKSTAATSAIRCYSGTVVSGGDHGSSYHFWTGLINGGSTTIYQDGASSFTGNPGANGIGTLIVGCNEGGVTEVWDGQIADLIIFTGAMSSLNRTTMHTYLAAKWGI